MHEESTPVDAPAEGPPVRCYVCHAGLGDVATLIGCYLCRRVLMCKVHIGGLLTLDGQLRAVCAACLQLTEH
jgi:hypothetical protein